MKICEKLFLDCTYFKYKLAKISFHSVDFIFFISFKKKTKILGEFDMRVKSCSAFTENSRPIDLSDEHGCVLRPKMISKFMKIAGADTRATVVTYAFFHAFKFPDSMAVNIRCKVWSEMTTEILLNHERKGWHKTNRAKKFNCF